jgi:hypothetical protein
MKTISALKNKDFFPELWCHSKENTVPKKSKKNKFLIKNKQHPNNFSTG